MPKRKSTLCLEHYDCIGFDLDHTLCRYNIGPMIRYSCYCIYLMMQTILVVQLFKKCQSYLLCYLALYYPSRLEYRLLTEFLVNKKGYDPAIKLRRFDDDQDVVCKGTVKYS